MYKLIKAEASEDWSSENWASSNLIRCSNNFHSVPLGCWSNSSNWYSNIYSCLIPEVIGLKIKYLSICYRNHMCWHVSRYFSCQSFYEWKKLLSILHQDKLQLSRSFQKSSYNYFLMLDRSIFLSYLLFKQILSIYIGS